MDTRPAFRSPTTPTASSGLVRPAAMVVLLAFGLALSGCASNGGIGKAVNRTLETVGLKEAEAEPTERRIPLRLYAGENLNAGNDRRGLAAVVKVYHLRNARRFEQTPFEAFLDETRERQALGDDLVGVSEVILSPGTRHEVVERLPMDAETLGVVALFRAPARDRWRLAFDATQDAVQKDGVTIGLHACAMTTGSAALATRISGDPGSLASVQCQRSR